MESLIAFFGAVSALASAWAALSANRISRRLYQAEVSPCASVQITSGKIHDHGSFQTVFANHGKRSCSIDVRVMVHSGKIGEWRKAKGVYNGEAAVTLQVGQSLVGQFVWNQNVDFPDWPDQLAGIRAGEEVFFSIDATVADDGVDRIEVPLQRSIYRLRLMSGNFNSLYMEPLFERDWVSKVPK